MSACPITAATAPKGTPASAALVPNVWQIVEVKIDDSCFLYGGNESLLNVSDSAALFSGYVNVRLPAKSLADCVSLRLRVMIDLRTAS